MLDQLVESKSTIEKDRKRGGLLFTTSIFVISLFFGGLLWSLFAQNVGVTGEGLELSTLVAPVPIPEEAPPKPEPKKKIIEKIDVDIRTDIIRNINESPTEPPKEISTKKPKIPPRRQNRLTMIGSENIDSSTASIGQTRVVNEGEVGGIGSTEANNENILPKPPPPPPQTVPRRISRGVVNAEAISLPKPPFPAAAKAVRAKGKVPVSIIISKTGKVISAKATGGHPLLRKVSEAAARKAKFRPTTLSKVPVEVSGVIVYNFK